MAEQRSTGSRIYQELVEHVRAKRTLFVVGTGVSLGATRGAHTASWTGLIKDGLRYCQERDVSLPPDWAEGKTRDLDAAAARNDLDDLIGVATTIERRLGGPKRTGGDWAGWLRNTIGGLEVHDRRTVDALRAVGRGRLATCNYDDVLTSSEYPAVPWTQARDVIRVLNGEDQGVIHFHGHWKTPESVVLGYSSYDDVLKSNHAQTIQRALAALSSLVFVGFGLGLEDPNFGPLLRWMDETFSERESHHFRLVRDDERLRAYATNVGDRVAVLGYGPRHDDLPLFLNRLAADAGLATATASAQSPRADAAITLVTDLLTAVDSPDDATHEITVQATRALSTRTTDGISHPVKLPSTTAAASAANLTAVSRSEVTPTGVAAKAIPTEAPASTNAVLMEVAGVSPADDVAADFAPSVPPYEQTNAPVGQPIAANTVPGTTAQFEEWTLRYVHAEAALRSTTQWRHHRNEKNKAIALNVIACC